MKNISIVKINHSTFEVKLNKDEITKHIVHLSNEVYENYTKGKLTKEQFITKSFLFLLQREANTSILKEFKIEQIADYFPDFNKILEMGWIDLSG